MGTLIGGSFSGAYGINNAGQVTGVSATAGSTHTSHDGLRAFVWQNGVMTDLGTLGGSDSYSYGLGINDAGQIVGESSPAGLSPSHAFLWQNGVMSDLGTLGETSTANAINSTGQVVGVSQAPGSPSFAVRWQNGVMSDVGGPASVGQAINDSGQVAGWATVYPEAHPLNGEIHPIVWQQNGSATDLDPLGGSAGYALGINNVGQAVGYSSVSTSSHAFLWQNSGRTDLGTLGGPFSTAYSITDDGQILGASSPTSGTSYGHAFLWDSQHGMRNLNDLIDNSSGWTLHDARQMNDAGQIVGNGTNPDGFQHGYLLTPIPEPRSFVLTALGCFEMVALRTRRRKS